MAIYPYKCKKCGWYDELMFTIADRKDSVKCPECGGKATRRIGVSSADCFSERPGWIASVADVIDPGESHAAREFHQNRTRENYQRFMEHRGLRHVEHGEKLGKQPSTFDRKRVVEKMTENLRRKKRIEI